jgi:hypothetical protein
MFILFLFLSPNGASTPKSERLHFLILVFSVCLEETTLQGISNVSDGRMGTWHKNLFLYHASLHA